MENRFDLQGQVAVITGGSGVICSVIAKGLAESGVKVAVLGRNELRVKQVAEDIIRNGGIAAYYSADVLKREQLEYVREDVCRRFGTVDILINGAGGNNPVATVSEELSFFDIDQASFESVFSLNITGVILATQVFGALFAKQGHGCVVNISSMAAYHPLTKTVAYSAAKAAVSNFTQWMAVHFNQNYSKDIRVNAIAPGFLITKQNQYLLLSENGSLTERGEKVLLKTPMARFGEPDELVGTVQWLCSRAASFVNGAVIPVDGGFSSYWGI